MNTKRITLGVIAAALANWIVGAIWYSPLLFINRWLELTKVNVNADVSVMGTMLGALLLALITAAIMACFMYRMRINTLMGGFHFGWMCWLGFVGATTFQLVIFEQRPFELWAINNGFNLIVLIDMGMILAYALKNEHFTSK